MNTEMVALASPSFTLDQVAVHFEDWRRQKRRGDRIPEQLWSEAIALVADYGLSQVTRRLRLSGRDLNRRRGIVGSGRRRRRRRAEQPAAFVELVPAVDVQMQRRQSTAVCLELIRPDGLRLRIESEEGIEPRTVLERFMEMG